MQINSDNACCGIGELEGVQDYEDIGDVIGAMASHYGADGGPVHAFLYFSDVKVWNPDEVMNDRTLKKYESKAHQFISDVRKEKLGAIKYLGTRKNDNSANYLDMWVWMPNAKTKQKVRKQSREMGDYDDDYYFD